MKTNLLQQDYQIISNTPGLLSQGRTLVIHDVSQFQSDDILNFFNRYSRILVRCHSDMIHPLSSLLTSQNGKVETHYQSLKGSSENIKIKLQKHKNIIEAPGLPKLGQLSADIDEHQYHDLLQLQTQCKLSVLPHAFYSMPNSHTVIAHNNESQLVGCASLLTFQHLNTKAVFLLCGCVLKEYEANGTSLQLLYKTLELATTFGQDIFITVDNQNRPVLKALAMYDIFPENNYIWLFAVKDNENAHSR